MQSGLLNEANGDTMVVDEPLSQDRHVPAPSFNALPMEIAIIIFGMLLLPNNKRSNPFEPISRMKPLVSITLVCRHWYQIAVGAPTLWSTVTFTSESFFPSDTLELWLERAGNSLLDVNILSTSPRVRSLHPGRAFRRLHAQSARWERLRIFLSGDDLNAITELLPTHLPALKECKAWVGSSFLVSGHAPLPITLISAPQLKSMTTTGTLLFGSCEALSSLEISDFDRTQWRTISSRMKGLPSLKSLTFRWGDLGFGDVVADLVHSRLEIPSLEELTLDMKSPEALRQFLAVLDAPRLTILRIPPLSFIPVVSPPTDDTTKKLICLPSLREVHFTYVELSIGLTVMENVRTTRRPQLFFNLSVQGSRNYLTEVETPRKALSKSNDVIVNWMSGAPR